MQAAAAVMFLHNLLAAPYALFKNKGRSSYPTSRVDVICNYLDGCTINPKTCELFSILMQNNLV